MRIHHLNCSTFCPLGGHYMDGMTSGFGESKLVCHCLLIESEVGLILVDTGLGMKDIEEPKKRMSGFFRNLLRPVLWHQETAIAQIRELGFSPNDVRHIILTHLDFDHAGGIDDFPYAEVHLMQDEKEAAIRRKGLISRRRYSPPQFTNIHQWNTYQTQGEDWFGFEAVRELKGLPPEILLVPLKGHTQGHAGVAIAGNDGWHLHAGDAYFYRGEMAAEYTCTPGLRAYQKMMDVDRKARRHNQERLRSLVAHHGNDVEVFSAHDPMEYLRLKERASQIFSVGDSQNNFLNQ